MEESGALVIDGHDLGPATAPVSDDGEYEWNYTYDAAVVPAVVAALGGAPGDDVLDLLQRHWTGARSYELEKRLRESKLPHGFWRWP